MTHMARHPPIIVLLAIGACFAVGLAGVAAAVAVMVAGALLASIAAVFPTVQRAFADLEHRRTLELRRDRRYGRLVDARVPTDELRALTSIADDMARFDPSSEAIFDVEGLLDHYATVAVAHARCATLTAEANHSSLMHELERVDAGRPGARRAVLERRLTQWSTCKQREDELQCELASTAEMVRLVALHSALARVGGDIDPDAIEHRLELLSAEQDAATAIQ